MSTVAALVAAIVLVAANAVFAAAELSLVATSRRHLDQVDATHDRRSALVAGALARLPFHLSGLQLGITACSITLGVLARPAVADLLDPLLDGIVDDRVAAPLSMAVALALVTVVHVVVGELVPRAIALARPLETARSLSGIQRLYVAVAGPVIWVFAGAASWIVRRAGIQPREGLGDVRSRSELVQLVADAAAGGTLEAADAQLLTRVLRFGDKVVGQVLRPRPDIVALGVEDTGADLLAATGRTGYSRFPVTGRDLDDVVGVVRVTALLDVPPEERATVAIADLMDPPLVVPETAELDDLLVELRSGVNPMAVVLDEYGGTAGIVTVEDIVEEIVGDISDEHDRDPQPDWRVVAGSRVLSGGLRRDELVELAGFELPDGDYETLAGFILERLGRMASRGDVVEYDGWRFVVVATDRHRIAEVKVVPPPPEAA